MSLERLDPGAMIEITDPILPCRKIALVDDTGLGYFDLIGPDELPHPIHSEMRPVVLGAIHTWSALLPAEFEPYFIKAWDDLLLRNLDVLQVARGLAYAAKNQEFDAKQLYAVAIEETDKIREARALLAQALS